MQIAVLGNVGSDAGYWVLTPNGWRHVGGWGIDSIVEVRHAFDALSATARFKTPGLAAAATKGLGEFVQKELSTHFKDGGVLIV